MSWWDFKDISRNLSTIKNQITNLVVDDDSLDPELQKQIEHGELQFSEKCSSCQCLIDKLNKDTIEFKIKIKSLLDDRKMILESQDHEISQLKSSLSYSTTNELSEEVKNLRIKTSEQAAFISELNDKISVYSSTNKALSDRVRETMNATGNFENENDLKARYENAVKLLNSADKCLEMCEKKFLEKCTDFNVSDLKDLLLCNIKDDSLKKYFESTQETDSLTTFISGLGEFMESTKSCLHASFNEQIEKLKSNSNKTNTQLEKTVSELKTSRKDLENEINRLKLHLIDNEERHNTELSDLSKSYSDVKSLLENKEKLYTIENEKMTEELRNVKELLEKFKRESSDLNKQNSDLRSKLEASNCAVANQSKINDELHKALCSIKDDHDANHDIISKRFENDKKSIEARLSEDLLMQKSLTEQLQKEIFDLKNKLKSVNETGLTEVAPDFESSPKEIKIEYNREELVTTLELLKNVICTYKKSPPERKSQVFSIICNILGLDKCEISAETSPNSSLLEYIPIFGRFIATPSEKTEKEHPQLDDSLSNLLINFLDKEAAKGEVISNVSIEKLRGMINEIDAVPYSLEGSNDSIKTKTRLSELL